MFGLATTPVHALQGKQGNGLIREKNLVEAPQRAQQVEDQASPAGNPVNWEKIFYVEICNNRNK
jgi:hypothetical protein